MRAPFLRWIAVTLIALCVPVAAAQSFPKHWGNPPAIQTRDMRPLPGGYGHGSTTLANWIQQNLARDSAGKSAPGEALVLVKGELREGRRATFALEGPADGGERGYRVAVRFSHPAGEVERTIRAAREKGGARWLVEFTPEKAGRWNYRVSFLEGEKAVAPYHGRTGHLMIAPKE